MIRDDFPYIPGHQWPDSVACPVLAAVGASFSGNGTADGETGDTDAGAWFARFDCGPSESLGTMLRDARGLDGADFPFPEGSAVPQLFGDGPGAWAGFIYGRDSDGREIVGAWRSADRLARVWNHLSGAWAEPDSGFAIRAAENESRHRVRFGHGVRVELADGFRSCGTAFRLVGDSGADILIQTDTDFPGVAGMFGWRPRGPFGCECHRETDGTTDCPACGKSAADFISEAAEHIDAVYGTGIRAEDPGFFDTPDGAARSGQ